MLGHKGKNVFDLVGQAQSSSARQTDSQNPIKRVSRKEIAIIGMGVKFPLADNVEDFWQNLRKGIDCIRKIPQQRKNDVEAYLRFINRQPEETGHVYEDAAYLETLDAFDCGFFKVSPKEASLMDPNQRLFLETAWTAIEDAGYGGGCLEGSRTGVYVGFGGESEYKKLIADVEPDALSLAVPANLPPIIASRLSYLMDLKGPSMLVNTVCSSSLVAVHLACQGIRSGECDLAVAGGVQVYVLPIRQARLGVESSDFRTKSFDNSSDGTGSGEGVAAVLLKPLNKAIKDGDHIYGIIKGGAVNQDGRSIGISAPNPLAQEDVLCRAWQDAGIDPETISYIEAHGTGTKLGDPIEIQGIQQAFARFTPKKQFCALGSVKSNIGHLDNSAGIAGLIKAVLALTHKEIPPTLHFQQPNRRIPFHQSPVYINDMLSPWETTDQPRRCGVSSFSFSGTNCHLVLEEAPEPETQIITQQHPEILTLSAETTEGLKTLVNQYKQLIQSINQNQTPVLLPDLCFTANIGRGHYTRRLAFLIPSTGELAEKLANLDPDHFKPGTGIYYGIARETPPEQIKVLNHTARQMMTEFRDQGNTKNPLHILQRLCELYVKGAKIDWDEFYQVYQGGRSKRNRVSLPAYPFAPRRCWLDIPVWSDKDEGYHTFGWIEEELPVDTGKVRKGTCLILGDRQVPGQMSGQVSGQVSDHGQALAEKIANGLRQQGTTVIHADTQPDQYETLLADPQLENLTQILHLPSLFNPDDAESKQELENQLENGVYSLFHLVRALPSRGKNRETIDLVMVSDNVHEVTGRESMIHPVHATLFGLGKVVNLENFNIKCRTVDIDENTDPDSLIREITAGYSEYKVAYRGSQRYVEELVPLEPGRINDSGVSIKSEGVYIITGGSGGLGLEIASHLAARNRVNIALVNRTRMPDRSLWPSLLNSQNQEDTGTGTIAATATGTRTGIGIGTVSELAGKIIAIRHIEETGSQVCCCCADVSKTAEIEETLVFLRKKFKKINGIIHCAAVGSGQAGKLIKDDNIDIFKQVMAPKVQGTWILDRLTRGDQLDFFVVFSGAITLMGGIGSGSYTAANSYLNSFTAYRNRTGQRTIAIGWAVWQESLKKYNIGFDSRRHLFHVQSSAEIIHAFSEILGKEMPMVIYGKLNYKSEIFYLGKQLPMRLSKQLRNRVNGHTSAGQSRGPHAGFENRGLPQVQVKGRQNADYSEFETQMAQIFGEFLGYREIDIHDNFYELGGDSIIAAKMINQANQRLGLNIAVEELLKSPTIEELAKQFNRKQISQTSLTVNNAPEPNRGKAMNFAAMHVSIKPVEKKEYYPASEFQESAFILSQLKGGQRLGLLYHLPTALLVEGNVDVNRFRAIFQELARHHEALRTFFVYVDKQPVQRIQDKVTIPLEYIEGGDIKCIDDLVSEFMKPFNLEKAPLFRVLLAKLEPGASISSSASSGARYLLLMDMHHSISDGQSWVNVLKDFMALYRGNLLHPLEVQFKDFIENRKNRGQEHLRAVLQKQGDFWRDMFKDNVPELNMPLDNPRPWMQSFNAESLNNTLGEDFRQHLNRLASQCSATLFMVLLAAFYVLIFKLTGNRDMVIGVPAAGRHWRQLEPIVGCFVNILPLRMDLNEKNSFKELTSLVKSRVIQAFENQDYPFGELVSRLGIQKQLGRNPVYDVMFAMQIHEQPEIDLEGLKFTPYNITKNFTDVDLNLDVNENENRLVLRWQYCKKIYKKETISGLASAYTKILEIVSRDSDMFITDIAREL